MQGLRVVQEIAALEAAVSQLTQQGRQAKRPKAEQGDGRADASEVQGVVAQLKRQLDAHADDVKVAPPAYL